MADNSARSRPPRRGGGVFIAAGLVAGGILGAVNGLAALGLLAGLVLGILATILLAMADRR
jgi:hypothetical protein